MDNSEEDVTLLSGFVFDVLGEYKDMRRLCKPIFNLADALDASHPEYLCSIRLYNLVCTKIEEQFGPSSVRNAGRAIGERAYGRMTQDGTLGANPTPLRILSELKRVASRMIQDPKKRGWEVLGDGPAHVLMRRTQTFNCILQEGLLLALVEKTGVLMPRIDHARCTRRKDPFCEYRVEWTLSRTRG